MKLAAHGDGEEPIAGATISGHWSSNPGAQVSCETGGGRKNAGSCSLKAGGLPTSLNTVTFVVGSITATGFDYDAAANHDPDGDSDGTSITIAN